MFVVALECSCLNYKILICFHTYRQSSTGKKMIKMWKSALLDANRCNLTHDSLHFDNIFCRNLGDVCFIDKSIDTQISYADVDGAFFCIDSIIGLRIKTSSAASKLSAIFLRKIYFVLFERILSIFFSCFSLKKKIAEKVLKKWEHYYGCHIFWAQLDRQWYHRYI